MSIFSALRGKSCLKQKCKKCLRGEKHPCNAQCSLYRYKRIMEQDDYLAQVKSSRAKRIRMFEETERKAKEKMSKCISNKLKRAKNDSKSIR